MLRCRGFSVRLSINYEQIELVPDRPNYDLRYWMKNDKAVTDLDWKPEKDIVDELGDVVEWYKRKFA